MSETRVQAERLWEADHPYYCNEGNFYSNDCHEDYDSWGSFVSQCGDSDPDMNLVIRWDWRDGEYEQPDPDHKGVEYLYLYFVLQRKAILRSCKVAVLREEEPAIREWLTERRKTIDAIWEPVPRA